MRLLLAILALAAPVAAQVQITRDPIPATRPEVTHHLTADKSIHYGEVWYEFDLSSIGDITATNRNIARLPDGRRDLDGAVVQIHGIEGFPAGSEWDDYVVRTDMLWFSEYDWVFRENTSQDTRPPVEVSTYMIPRLMCFDVRHYSDSGHQGTGIGLSLYAVSFGLGHQDLGSEGPYDGLVNWSGSSGSWSGEVNNTNPTADNQEMSGDYWTARRLWAEYGDTDAEVPVYFVPETGWLWSDNGYDHDCRMALPEPGCIGCDPQPMDKGLPCGGHASTWMYGERMDIRGTGGPTGGGWRMRIRVVPTDSLPLEYQPDPRELLGLALSVTERRRWPEIMANKDRIVSVDRTDSGRVLIGYREELPIR